jgi:hypothetical protein
VLVTPERAKKINDASALGSLDLGGLGGPGSFDPSGGLRREQARAEDERKALEEKVRKLTEDLEKLKK